MAKITAPLMSAEARGKFGPRLVFSKRKSGQQVRHQRAQTDKITSARTAHRQIYAAGVEVWNNLTDEQKDEYDRQAAQLEMTGYNLFMKEYLIENSGGEATAIYGQGIYGIAVYGNA